jgi:hypothetical protein
MRQKKHNITKDVVGLRLREAVSYRWQKLLVSNSFTRVPIICNAFLAVIARFSELAIYR